MGTWGSRCLEVAAVRLDSGADRERTKSPSQEFLHLLIKHRGNRIEPGGRYPLPGTVRSREENGTDHFCIGANGGSATNEQVA